MGVDLSTWCNVVLSNPLRFKFEGLDGFHRTVTKAAANDRQFMERYVDNEIASYAEAAKNDYAEDYYDYLRHRLRLGRHDELIREVLDQECTPRLLELLEEELGDLTYEWASEYVDMADIQGDVEGMDDEYLLSEHPPEEVWNEAYGCGFPLDRAIYLCPSCGRQAMTVDELQDNGGRHYCSLCGSEYLESHCFIQDFREIFSFASDCGARMWPFGLYTEAGKRVWWEAQEESLRGWYTVVSKNDATREVTLEGEQVASYDDVMPEGLMPAPAKETA